MTYSWDQVGNFPVAKVRYGRGATQMVGFTDSSARHTRLGRANTALVGRTSALADTYGFAPGSLAQLMSLWHDRALSQQASHLDIGASGITSLPEP